MNGGHRFLVAFVLGVLFTQLTLAQGWRVCRAFCRWRLAVWTRRLNRRRAIWSDVQLNTEQNLYWEAQVTRAIVKQTKWRKRVRAS